jgi:hypothetical protein
VARDLELKLIFSVTSMIAMKGRRSSTVPCQAVITQGKVEKDSPERIIGSGI